MKIELTERQYRYLLDLVYIGNWVLNSTREDDRIQEYDQVESLIFSRLEGVQVRVQKTQVSFYQKRLFACVSFTPVRPKNERPPLFFTLTLGLGRRLDSPRVDAATEPYPGRWTHHMMLSDSSQLDKELVDWIIEASQFSQNK